MKQNHLRSLTEVSLFAALICVVVFFIRIPFGSQFVHLGNALVVVGVLLFGSKKEHLRLLLVWEYLTCYLGTQRWLGLLY